MRKKLHIKITVKKTLFHTNFSSALMLCCRENFSYIFFHIFLQLLLPSCACTLPLPPPSLQASLSLRSMNSLIRRFSVLYLSVPASFITQTSFFYVSLTHHHFQDIVVQTSTPVILSVIHFPLNNDNILVSDTLPDLWTLLVFFFSFLIYF